MYLLKNTLLDLQVCLLVWIYCLSITLPPFFGWSKYVLEGFDTSCSWDYTTRTLSNRLFYIYMLILGFVLPVSIITYCYIFIIVSILDHNKEMADCNSNIRSQLSAGKGHKCINYNINSIIMYTFVYSSFFFLKPPLFIFISNTYI